MVGGDVFLSFATVSAPHPQSDRSDRSACVNNNFLKFRSGDSAVIKGRFGQFLNGPRLRAISYKPFLRNSHAFCRTQFVKPHSEGRCRLRLDRPHADPGKGHSPGPGRSRPHRHCPDRDRQDGCFRAAGVAASEQAAKIQFTRTSRPGPDTDP